MFLIVLGGGTRALRTPDCVLHLLPSFFRVGREIRA